MISFASFALAAASVFPAALPAETVAVQAGTIHLVENGTVLRDGTVLIRDGKIAAVGTDVNVPAGATVVDYGPDAVIVPGLVAADTGYGSSLAAPRTAEPGLLAIDNFDPYSELHWAIGAGVTSAYLAPARGRLIAGQGAVVKTAGGPDADRVVSRSTGLHGSISADARRVPGYWEPPIPATVDVGMGLVQKQLPRTTMGAVVALNELLALARGEGGEEFYGDTAGPQLKRLIDEGVTWRLGAQSAEEIRAVLGFARRNRLPVVIDGARDAADVVEEIKASGVAVIYAPFNGKMRDFGKSPDSAWPRYDGASALAAAGIKVAIGKSRYMSTTDLRFAAALAARGGVTAEAALRAITLTPAEVLGVADRVGSIKVGKDADLAVFSGAPLEVSSAVLATWVAGEAVSSEAQADAAVVIEVDELHVGDGKVLSPGSILIKGGKIVEVGRTVGKPSGATVVRGRAAMPGMIDALGHLGLEGSGKSFSTRFDLTRIVEPGDYADRRVARAGVTTVVLGSKGNLGSGSPTMAYKPAADSFDSLVVNPSNALRVEWSEQNRSTSGKKVLKALEKAKEYKEKWAAFEKEMAEWKPEPEKPDKDDDKKEGDEDKDEEGDDKDKDDDKKKKKKKKKKGDDAPAAPVTGIWEGTATASGSDEGVRLRLQINDVDGVLEGNARCDALSSTLIETHGERTDSTVTLSGHGSSGRVSFALTADEDKLSGTASVAGQEFACELEQKSKEYVVARRSELRRAPSEKDPKGMPRSPGINPDLEPYRQAMLGKAAIVVTVDRSDEILECVDAFASYGIKPVLFGADHAHKVARKIKGRVAGVMLSRDVTATSAKTGIKTRNRYAELASAGIPVAFHSRAEEGAVELPLLALYAVAKGMSPTSALRALTADAADMLAIGNRVGRLRVGNDADVLLLDGSPMDAQTSVVRTWVAGKEVR